MKIALKIGQEHSEESRELKQNAMVARDQKMQAEYFLQDLACKAKTADLLFEQTGVEREDLDRAVKFYYQSDRTPTFPEKLEAIVRESVLAQEDTPWDEMMKNIESTP